MNQTLKEWLGLTPQDGLLYAVAMACAAMYLGKAGWLDSLASLLALGASFVACLWGMKPDPRLSHTSNWIKRVSYPVCFVFVLVWVYLNFQIWNPRS